LNIAFFSWRDPAHPRAGGAEAVTFTLAKGLCARGHSVTLFAGNARGAPASEKRDGVSIVRAGGAVWCRFAAAAWLRAHAAEVDVAVDQVNTLPFFSPWIARRKTLLLIYQTARDVWFAEGPPGFRRLGYAVEPWYMRIYRHTRVVTISKSTARSLRDVGVLGPVDVIDVAVPRPENLVPDLIPCRVGIVGRVTPSKRIDHLIEAVAMLRVSRADAHLVVVGDGEREELLRLQAAASRFGIAEAVRFTGRLDDRARDREMAAFDAFAMTSLREGWGLAISEAAWFGVPSVVYPVPGLVDAVVDGTTGIVVGDCSPRSLCSGLARLLSDRDLRNRLGNAARARVGANTESAMVDQFEAVLNDSRTSGDGALSDAGSRS
jgi:glycosyltransferase involved in cell wall biosynthesis